MYLKVILIHAWVFLPRLLHTKVLHLIHLLESQDVWVLLSKITHRCASVTEKRFGYVFGS